MSLIAYAPASKRVLATLVDYATVYAFFFWFLFMYGTPNETDAMEINGAPVLIPMGFWFCWLMLPEMFWGQTAGHALAGIKVVRINGRKPGFSQAVLRRLGDVLDISWCFGLIAFILVKSTLHHQRLGDLWAKTVVIEKHSAIPDIYFDFEKTAAAHSKPADATD